MSQQEIKHHHTSVVGLMHKVVNVLGLAAVAAIAACGTILVEIYALQAWHHFMH